MTYLVNDAVTSSFWLYRGMADERPLSGAVTVPTGVALFPAEFYPKPSRALAEPGFAITRWTEMPRGGHFAAFEQPALFAEDVLAFADTLG